MEVPRVPMTPSLREHCKAIVDELFQMPTSAIFRVPVDPERDGVPDYREIITHPMDLGSIYQRLAAASQPVGGRDYYATLDAFAADVRRVFSNCYTYNNREVDAPTRALAQPLDARFERWVLDLLAYPAKYGLDLQPVGATGAGAAGGAAAAAGAAAARGEGTALSGAASAGSAFPVSSPAPASSSASAAAGAATPKPAGQAGAKRARDGDSAGQPTPSTAPAVAASAASAAAAGAGGSSGGASSAIKRAGVAAISHAAKYAPGSAQYEFWYGLEMTWDAIKLTGNSRKMPLINNKSVDLYEAYCKVMSYGGFDVVNGVRGGWVVVYKEVQAGTDNASAYRFKRTYERMILEYERRIKAKWNPFAAGAENYPILQTVEPPSSGCGVAADVAKAVGVSVIAELVRKTGTASGTGVESQILPEGKTPEEVSAHKAATKAPPGMGKRNKRAGSAGAAGAGFIGGSAAGGGGGGDDDYDDGTSGEDGEDTEGGAGAGTAAGGAGDGTEAGKPRSRSGSQDGGAGGASSASTGGPSASPGTAATAAAAGGAASASSSSSSAVPAPSRRGRRTSTDPNALPVMGPGGVAVLGAERVGGPGGNSIVMPGYLGGGPIAYSQLSSHSGFGHGMAVVLPPLKAWSLLGENPAHAAHAAQAQAQAQASAGSGGAGSGVGAAVSRAASAGAWAPFSSTAPALPTLQYTWLARPAAANLATSAGLAAAAAGPLGSGRGTVVDALLAAAAAPGLAAAAAAAVAAGAGVGGAVGTPDRSVSGGAASDNEPLAGSPPGIAAAPPTLSELLRLPSSAYDLPTAMQARLQRALQRGSSSTTVSCASSNAAASGPRRMHNAACAKCGKARPVLLTPPPAVPRPGPGSLPQQQLGLQHQASTATAGSGGDASASSSKITGLDDEAEGAEGEEEDAIVVSGRTGGVVKLGGERSRPASRAASPAAHRAEAPAGVGAEGVAADGAAVAAAAVASAPAPEASDASAAGAAPAHAGAADDSDQEMAGAGAGTEVEAEGAAATGGAAGAAPAADGTAAVEAEAEAEAEEPPVSIPPSAWALCASCPAALCFECLFPTPAAAGVDSEDARQAVLTEAAAASCATGASSLAGQQAGLSDAGPAWACKSCSPAQNPSWTCLPWCRACSHPLGTAPVIRDPSYFSAAGAAVASAAAQASAWAARQQKQPGQAQAQALGLAKPGAPAADADAAVAAGSDALKLVAASGGVTWPLVLRCSRCRLGFHGTCAQRVGVLGYEFDAKRLGLAAGMAAAAASSAAEPAATDAPGAAAPATAGTAAAGAAGTGAGASSKRQFFLCRACTSVLSEPWAQGKTLPELAAALVAQAEAGEAGSGSGGSSKSLPTPAAVQPPLPLLSFPGRPQLPAEGTLPAAAAAASASKAQLLPVFASPVAATVAEVQVGAPSAAGQGSAGLAFMACSRTREVAVVARAV